MMVRIYLWLLPFKIYELTSRPCIGDRIDEEESMVSLGNNFSSGLLYVNCL